MRKGIILGLLLALFGTVLAAKAQEESSKYEVYGGYYYIRFNINANLPGVAPSATYNGYGGGGQLEYKAKNWLGVVGDLSGYEATSTGNGAFVGAFLTYLFGPRVNFRHGKLTPFAQTLFGGIRTTDGIGESTGAENNFAMTAGGGIDFKVSRYVSVRPMQAEYFMTKMPNGLNNRENNLRIGAGIAVRLGK